MVQVLGTQPSGKSRLATMSSCVSMHVPQQTSRFSRPTDERDPCEVGGLVLIGPIPILHGIEGPEDGRRFQSRIASASPSGSLSNPLSQNH